MAEVFWLDDEQWSKLAPLLPNDTRGVPRVDDRRVISGIIEVMQSGGRWRLKAVGVGVPDKEGIHVEGRAYDCYVVESPGARAWIDEAGRTRRQVVDVPGVGKLEIREEAFRREQYDTMLRRIRGITGH